MGNQEVSQPGEDRQADIQRLIDTILYGQKEERDRAFGDLVERYVDPLVRRLTARYRPGYFGAVRYGGATRGTSENLEQKDLARLRKDAAEGWIDEIRQIVWLKIWESLRLYDPAKGNFESWCHRIIKNTIIDQRRREIRSRKLVFENEDSASEDILEKVPDRDTDQLIDSLSQDLGSTYLAALEKLRPKPRVIFVVVAGLWDNMPPDIQRAWLAEANLPPDFPPADVHQAESVAAGCERLAKVLGQLPDALRRTYYRACKTLARLLSGAKENGNG
jgi:RNA polymerase sigma factor (sigma-70 family)